MKRTSALLAGCMAIACAVVFLPSTDGGGAKAPQAKDILTFKTRVKPSDPFDPRNESGANGIWKVRRGEVVRVEFEGSLQEGWITYPITQRASDQQPLSRWSIAINNNVTPLLPIYESTPKKVDEPSLGLMFKYANHLVWSQDVLIDKDAPPGKLAVTIALDTQVCKGSCIPFKWDIPVEFEVSSEAPETPSAETLGRAKTALDALKKIETVKPVPPPVKSEAKAEGLIRDSFEQYKANMEAIAAKTSWQGNITPDVQSDPDLLGFVLAGIFWGAISLITPCVFPMIPITVSFFLKQSEKEHHRPVFMASIYSLTIVVVLTLAAAFLLSVFREMSVHPVTNYIIGGLFVFFALSLFGMYEIELPQSLAQFTSSREGRGGVVGTIFMALTFTIISFACVAPFLGGFGGTAASARPLWHNLLGGFSFAATFASPFFFLAMFPALLKKLPKSGSWLNVVKVVMGFLEFAAAFKFFRSAELIHTHGKPDFFTFDLVLAFWVAMCVLSALYLLGMFRLPHDSPEEHISVPRLLFSIAFLGLAFHLSPALFKLNEHEGQRPKGVVYAWVDSFLLPDSRESGATADLNYAITKSREELSRTGKPKRIFLDFTGVNCTNCSLNENNVFTKPGVAKLFESYIEVKIYTDTVPLEFYANEMRADFARAGRPQRDAKETNTAFQLKLFDRVDLPFYAILEPQADGTIRVLGIYDKGLIKDVPEFEKFLGNPEGK